MKKLLFALGIAMVMVSCSSDETIDVVVSQPIAFGTAFVENSTRAVVTDDTHTTSKLDKFKVYGTVLGNGNTVNIYTGDEVTKTTLDADWDCTKTQYWVPNCSYNFIALVDADKEKDATNKNIVNLTNGLPSSIEYNLETQGDLLIADASRTQTGTIDASSISFTFSHLLAKAQFTFKNAFPSESGVELKVTGITLTAPKKATFTIDPSNDDKYGHWSTTAETYDIDFGATPDTYFKPTEEGTSHYARVLIPGIYNLSGSFIVNHNKGGQPTTIPISIQDITIEQGHSYNFVAELNSGNVTGAAPINFSIVKDNTWESESDKNVQQ